MDFPGPFFSALWQPAAGRAPGLGAFAGPALILATGRPDPTGPVPPRGRGNLTLMLEEEDPQRRMPRSCGLWMDLSGSTEQPPEGTTCLAASYRRGFCGCWRLPAGAPLEARRRHELGHVIRVTPYQLPVIDRAYPGAQEHPARSLNFSSGMCRGSRRGPRGGQSVGRRAWFTSRLTAQASATGPTCPSLSGLITERIVWIRPSSTSRAKVMSTLSSRSRRIAPGWPFTSCGSRVTSIRTSKGKFEASTRATLSAPTIALANC